jgi:glycogen(starch) synthase
MARILTLTNWYPPHHFGGYEALCDDVMGRLAARGHDIEVLCGNELRPGVTAAETAPYPVHRQLQMYWRDSAPWTPSDAEQRRIEQSNQRTLENALDRFRPEVVSVWAMGALSLNLLTTIAGRQIPMVYAVCDDWLIYGLDLDPWAGRWQGSPIKRLQGRATTARTHLPTVLPDLGRTGCFAYLSRYTRAATEEASPWTYPIDPVIYPGIDRPSFPPPNETERPWHWRLLYTGRLDTRKGTDTLLRALALLPTEATVSFLGRGEPAERERLEALAGQLGLGERVHFEEIPRSELPAAYASHDCFIFPSEWPEPFGMVPIEAMACGTPVVGTGVGGSGEFLHDRVNCLRFAPGDHAALARAVTELAEDPELRGALRRGGWVTADQFDLAWTVDAYEACHTAAAEHRLDTLALTPHPSQALSGPRGRIGALIDHHEPTHLSISWGSSGQAVDDPAHWPLSDATFDWIAVEGVLERVTNPGAFLAELHRVARPHARITITTRNRHTVQPWLQKARHRWQGWRRPPAHYAGDGVRRTYTASELEGLLRGFSITGHTASGWGGRSQALAARMPGADRLSPTLTVECTPV